MENTEVILLDGNKLAEGFSYHQIGGFGISFNNELIAYAEDTLSRRVLYY